MNAPIFPPLFRELDRVAAESFASLVSDKQCIGPTVEYWRDYFLVYQAPKDVRIRVGMERDWPVPFIFLEYKNDGHVFFDFRQVLGALQISIDSSEFSTCESLAESGWSEGVLSGIPEEQLTSEWTRYLVEYSQTLRAHFEEVLTYVATTGSKQAETGEEGSGGTVIQRTGEERTYDYVVAPGGKFVKAQFLPCDRETFWRIEDKGYSLTYSPATCPSCGYVGNGGWARKKTVASKLVDAAHRIVLLLLVISIASLLVVAIWHRDILIPLTQAAVGVFVLFSLTHWARANMLEYYCPKCEFVGPPSRSNGKTKGDPGVWAK